MRSLRSVTRTGQPTRTTSDSVHSDSMLSDPVSALSDDAGHAFASAVADVRARLAAALEGAGPAVEIVEAPAGSADTSTEAGISFVVEHPDDAPEGTAAVIRTSGSTGMPKRTALPADALKASAAATTQRIGTGHWLLALPLHYVAGLAVVSRAVLAGTTLVTMDLRSRFTAEAFAAATDKLANSAGHDTDSPPRLLTSLVPTQLTRLLESPQGIEALKRYAAVLVGGSATPPATLERARELCIPIVLTYGSAETCGGCVYDGEPLPGVSISIDSDGRVSLGGPQVASGYIGDPERTEQHFVTHFPDPRMSHAHPTRWYVTDDLGTLLPNGVLRIRGRIDDVINTGGVKVSAARIQAAIESMPTVREAVVVPVPHPEWGQTVGLIYAGDATEADIAAAVKANVSAAAVPRVVIRAGAIPRLSNHKPDRQAAVARLSTLI